MESERYNWVEKPCGCMERVTSGGRDIVRCEAHRDEQTRRAWALAREAGKQ